ncbi:hypothetical protein EDB85DRAFT_2243364 [Lactarius pseudohatsudake]|nr:hypothetical protein EDB85DRAFT_2243364 [Lactarius pseudohatsudake]
MLPLTMLRTLNGPIPTLFTGDPTHAVQFIEQLDSFVWKNRDNSLISTPWTRIDLALAFISGPTTLAWRRSIRCGRSTELAADTLWNDFLESFCETWVHSPESTASVVAPAVSTQTANAPSPSLAAVSTLKRVDDISIVLTKNELPPQHLSETIDQTADDEDVDDWASFAPRTELATPPPFIAITDQTPPPLHPPRKPRPASSISLLDLVKPVDEPPRLLYAPVHTAPVSLVPASTELREEDPQTDAANDGPSLAPCTSAPPPIPPSAISDVPLTDERALPTPPSTPESFTAIVPLRHPLHPYALSKKREHEYDADDEHAYPRKHHRIQIARRYRPLPRQYRYVRRPIAFPPPVDDSSGLSNPALDPPYPAQPAESQPSPPSLAFAPPSPRTVVMVDSIGLPTPAPIYQSPSTVRPAQPRSAILHAAIPLQLSSQPFSDAADLAADVERTPANPAFFPLSSRYSLSRPRLPSRPVSPPILSPLRVVTDDEDFERAMPPSAFAAFPASRPPSPPRARALSSARPPAVIVEDDKLSNGGVKTFDNSVLTPNEDEDPDVDEDGSYEWGTPISVLTSEVTSKSPISYYPPIFLPRAFEQPRDPDEVMPVARITRKRNTTPTAPLPTASSNATQNHANTSHRHLRATATEFVPRPAVTGPTQVQGIQIALQRPASNITRIPQNVIGTGRPVRNSSRQSDAETITQHAMSHTLRHRPRIRYSQIRDRHEQEVLTPVRIDTTTANRERVQAWHDQVISERTPRSTHYTPQQPGTNRDGHFTFPPDLRNNSHDYYPDTRLED